LEFLRARFPGEWAKDAGDGRWYAAGDAIATMFRIPIGRHTLCKVVCSPMIYRACACCTIEIAATTRKELRAVYVVLRVEWRTSTLGVKP
jgi:hypothetical protein